MGKSARITGVIYRLTKDEKRPGSYLLSRQEGQNLDFETYKPENSGDARLYTIAKDIKACSVMYEVGIEKKPEQQESSGDSSPKTSDKKNTEPKKSEIEYVKKL